MVFGDGQFNGVIQIYLRPTLVATATKFETKLAITRLIWEISPRSLRLSKGFRGRAIERCQSNCTATDPGCHGDEILAKISYSVPYMRDISEILASNRGFGGYGYLMMSAKLSQSSVFVQYLSFCWKILLSNLLFSFISLSRCDVHVALLA